MSNSNGIFNVDKVEGKELVYSTQLFIGVMDFFLCFGFIARHSALEATAAETKVAPEKNEQTMAEQAAAFAEVSRIYHIARSGTYEFFF